MRPRQNFGADMRMARRFQGHRGVYGRCRATSGASDEAFLGLLIFLLILLSLAH